MIVPPYHGMCGMILQYRTCYTGNARNAAVPLFLQLSDTSLDTSTAGDNPAAAHFMPVRERRRLSGYDDSGADVSRTVLTQFYNATGGTGWTDDTNWLSGTPCGNCTTTSCPSSSGAWVGISRCVGTATGNVPYKINLRNGGLIGTLPTELALLLSLTQLQLGSNQISGTLPTELGALTGLTVLNVKSNALSGTVPSQLGRLSQLQSFKLSANSLSGTLPTHLALLAPSASCEFANSVGQISNSFACPLPTLSSGCFVALSCNEYNIQKYNLF